MPPRWLGWLIGVFWVSMMGWMFWRDLWPSWRPGEPPPFHIDDADEVLRTGGGSRGATWIVLRQVGHDKPVPVFNAVTEMKYDKSLFTLKATLTPLSPRVSSAVIINGLGIQRMESQYSVDQAGHLHSLSAEVTVQPQLDDRKGAWLSLLRQLLLQERSGEGLEKSASASPVSLRIEGEVRDQQFFGHCSANARYLRQPIKLDLPPTAVSHTGSVLMPLHPVNQISHLSLDQHWRQPLIDPLRDALPGLSNSVRSLNAHVLPQPQMLKSNDGETSCLVIEYSNDENETMARTWVEQNSHRVLQQEAILEDSHWIMKRGLLSANERFHRLTPARNE